MTFSATLGILAMLLLPKTMNESRRRKWSKTPLFSLVTKIFFYLALLVGGLMVLALLWIKLSPPPFVLGEQDATILRSIAANGKFEIGFSAKMDRPSVEQAVSFSPPITGKFVWKNDYTVAFEPLSLLQEGARFELKIAAGAMDWLGKKTAREVRLAYTVTGPPKITMLSPISANNWTNFEKTRSGDQELLPTMAAAWQKGEPITVMFDQPMRPLANLELITNQVDPLQYLTFSPPVPGKIRWLGTTAFEFYADEAQWPNAKEITVTLNSGFPGLDGGTTTEAASWQLKTDPPLLISASAGTTVLLPSEDGKTFSGEHVLPDSAIALQWNMPLDMNSLNSALKIEPERKIQNDTLSRSEGDNSLIFLDFDPPLVRGETVTLSIDKNIAPLGGVFRSEEQYQLSFKTLSEPCAKLAEIENSNQTTTDPNGTIIIDFCTLAYLWDDANGKELTMADDVKSHLIFSPAVDPANVSVSCEPTQCIIGFPSKPSEQYQISFQAGLTDIFGQAIPTDGFLARISIRDYLPMLTPLVRNGLRSVYDAAEPVSIFFSARNANALQFTSCFVATETVRKIEADGGWQWNEFSCSQGGQNTRTRTVPNPGDRNATAILEVPLLPNNEAVIPGMVYHWEASADNVRNPWDGSVMRFAGTVYPVNAALTAYRDDRSVTVWATDFAEGKPIPSMNITLFDANGKSAGSGTTDERGLLTLQTPPNSEQFFLEGKKDVLKTSVGPYWNDGIAPWDFGFSADFRKRPSLTGVVITDRPIYRPGDSVQFKGILRSDDDANFTIPETKPVFVSIENNRGEKVFETVSSLDEFGTLAGDFHLAKETATGMYVINVSTDIDRTYEKTISGVFWTEEYKKPDFQIDFKNDKEEFVSGDTYGVTVNTSYFFGAPVKNATYEWHIVESPLYFDRWSGAGWYSFGTDETWCNWICPDTQEVVERGQGKTDASGNARIEFPIKTKTHKLYTLTVTAINPAGQAVSGTQTMPVFSGAFVLGVKMNDFWLDENATTVRAEVVAAETDGKALPGKKITAKLQQVAWNSIKKQDVDGNNYWENSQEFTDLATLEATTNGEGKAQVSFPLQNQQNYFGELRILVSAVDDKQNEIAASDRIWRSSENYASPTIRGNNDRIELTLDKAEVTPGESVRVLPASPFTEDTWAFVNVGRKEAAYRDVFLWKPGTPIEIKTTPEMLPNVFITVTLAKGKGRLYGVQNELAKRQEIKSALTEMQQKITALTAKSTDLATKLLESNPPVVTDALTKAKKDTDKELVLLMKSEAKMQSDIAALEQQIQAVSGQGATAQETSQALPRPEIKIGIAPLKVSPESKRLQLTITPDKPEYLPGEDVTVTIKAADSYGNPVENTDISLAVVDESLLALKSRENEDIFASFFNIRDLGIQLSSTLVYLIDRLQIDTLRGQKGGGGGRDLALLQKKRGEFRDTAFWTANLKTDGTGSVSTKFPLPDNITSWQIWATANTLDSKFGSTKMNFISKKPLIIQPVLPRFLIVGDVAVIGATLHNETDSELIIGAGFTAQNTDIIAKDTENFHLKAKEEKTLHYKVVARGSEESPRAILAPAVFTFTAKGDLETTIDTVEIEIPILPPAVGDTIATNGFLDETTNTVRETLQIPGGILPDIGKIFISVTPGAIGNITEGLAALAAFPYGCTEQIMSSLLPDLALLQLAKSDNTLFGDELNAEQVDMMINSGLQKIYDLQNTDGGFGFWSGSETSYPYLTAYVLFGLEQTLAAGISVDPGILDRTRQFLRLKVWEDIRETAPQKEIPMFPDADARAFAMFALSFSDLFDESMLTQLYEKRADMSAEGKAFLLMTARRVVDAASSPLPATIVQELTTAAIQTDREAHYQSGTNSWDFGSDTRSTAIVLWALLREDPDHALIPKLMAYLRGQKVSSAKYAGGPWGTTQNTAWTIFALIEFLKVHPLAASEITVAFNLDPLLSETLPRNAKTVTATKPLSEANAGNTENTVDIGKTGGAVSYDIVANYFLPVEKISAQNRGFGIFRELYAFDDKVYATPITSATQGDLLRGRITLLVPQDRYFTGVRIPIPAGTEAINFALETEDASLQNAINRCENMWCPDNESWRFTHQEYRDDHVFLFADYLPAGRYEFEFLLRATLPGIYKMLPSAVEEIYHPEVSGLTEGNIFEISALETKTTP